MKSKLKLLQEEVYGNLATVYHRTSEKNLANKIFDEGFKPGEGDMYGKALYATYRLDSQEKKRMKRYGDIIVKFAVPVKHFFIFDYNEFIKSPTFRKLKSTKETFIKDQVKYFDIELKIGLKNTYKDISSLLRKASYTSHFTSDKARKFVENTDIVEKVKGIIFTGRNDGRVLVVYDTKIAVPVSYKTDDEDGFNKIEIDKEYFKQSTVSKHLPKEISKPTIPEWIKNAKVKNMELIEYYKGKSSWLSGTWINGIWEDGRWINGIWHDGTWKNGTWEDGTWKNGIWRDGAWKNGIWEDGRWINGIWHDGTWKNGVANYIYWLDGTWENGIWRDGFFSRGSFQGGTWEDGYWLTTSKGWKNGTWKIGWINDGLGEGNLKPEWEREGDWVRSPINPKEYWSNK